MEGHLPARLIKLRDCLAFSETICCRLSCFDTEPPKSSGLESIPTRFLRTESGARAIFPRSDPENGMRCLDPEEYGEVLFCGDLR